MQKKYNLREWTAIGTAVVPTYLRDRQGCPRATSYFVSSIVVRLGAMAMGGISAFFERARKS